jgi:hypothetical protein
MAILLVLLMEDSTEVSWSLVALYSNQVLCESIHQFRCWGDRQVGTHTDIISQAYASYETRKVGLKSCLMGILMNAYPVELYTLLQKI